MNFFQHTGIQALIYALAGLILGVIGTAAYTGLTPQSVTKTAMGIAAESKPELARDSCRTEDASDIFFVSCGGFF